MHFSHWTAFIPRTCLFLVTSICPNVDIKQSVQLSAKIIAMSQLIEFLNLKQFNKIPNANFRIFRKSDINEDIADSVGQVTQLLTSMKKTIPDKKQ
jgi:hypothetical protein